MDKAHKTLKVICLILGTALLVFSSKRIIDYTGLMDITSYTIALLIVYEYARSFIKKWLGESILLQEQWHTWNNENK